MGPLAQSRPRRCPEPLLKTTSFVVSSLLGISRLIRSQRAAKIMVDLVHWCTTRFSPLLLCPSILSKEVTFMSASISLTENRVLADRGMLLAGELRSHPDQKGRDFGPNDAGGGPGVDESLVR